MESPLSANNNNNPQEKAKNSLKIHELHQYEGFWYLGFNLEKIKSLQKHFKADPSDIILASFPKTGSTWLKSLAFAIVTRSQNGNHHSTQSDLLTKTSHDCVPFMEINLSPDFYENCNARPELGTPLLATHLPYTSLPKSIVDCGCKIVYIWRDPKDVFVSSIFALNNILKAEGNGISLPLENEFEKFCNGKTIQGPYWDHVLGYWKVCLEQPNKVLFLKYEEVRNDPFPYLKKLAEFTGFPFTKEEEEGGVVENIIKMCGFESMSNLEVNKTGKSQFAGLFELDNSVFLRKGQAGDWRNHLTDEMGARLDMITEEKFEGSGLVI